MQHIHAPDTASLYYFVSAFAVVFTLWGSVRSFLLVRRGVLFLSSKGDLATQLEHATRERDEAIHERDEARRSRDDARASIEAARETAALNRETLTEVQTKVAELTDEVQQLRRESDDNLEYTAALFQHLLSGRPAKDIPLIPRALNAELMRRMTTRMEERSKQRADEAAHQGEISGGDKPAS